MAAVVVGTRLLDLLFPPKCTQCRRGGAVLCASCAAAARPWPEPMCAQCGEPLTPVVAGTCDPLCARCRRLRDAGNPVSAVRAGMIYEGVVRRAIRDLKFHGQRRMADPLAQWLAAAYHRAGWRADVIMPVPLHSTRERQRGYNQSMLLARASGRLLALPVQSGVIVRARNTAPQTGLSAVERQSNVAGAFALIASAAEWVCGKRVLLLDDVMTTGSTLRAAAGALHSAQPAAVLCLAVARPLHNDRPEVGFDR